MDHTPDCRWERTTEAECEYRATHHYCPHPEHACNCAFLSRSETPVDVPKVSEAEQAAHDGGHCDVCGSITCDGYHDETGTIPDLLGRIRVNSRNADHAFRQKHTDRLVASIESTLRVEAMILRDLLGQLRFSVRDRVEGVIAKLSAAAVLQRAPVPQNDAKQEVSEGECERATLVAEVWGDQSITVKTARFVLENFVAQRGRPIVPMPDIGELSGAAPLREEATSPPAASDEAGPTRQDIAEWLDYYGQCEFATGSAGAGGLVTPRFLEEQTRTAAAKRELLDRILAALAASRPSEPVT